MGGGSGHHEVIDSLLVPFIAMGMIMVENMINVVKVKPYFYLYSCLCPYSSPRKPSRCKVVIVLLIVVGQRLDWGGR